MFPTKNPGELVSAEDWNALVDFVNAAAPVGKIMAFAGSTAPSGYLLCNGAAVSRSTYADLFGKIGTTYGAGNGTTTFNLPDLRGRFPLGMDNMGGISANRVTATEADNLGQGAGLETHTLTTSEMPSHRHGLGFYHVASTANANLGSSNTWAGTASVASTLNLGAIVNGEHITNTGGGGAHNNVPPYLTLNYVIKF